MNDDVDAVLHAIFATNRLLREAGERIAASAGQTHSRRMVLQACSDRATVAEIARELGLQRQSVQRVSDELVRDELARYEDNPHHRVSRLLVLTTKGETALAAIHRAHVEWLEELEGSIGELDWAALHSGLDRIARAVRDVDSRT